PNFDGSCYEEGKLGASRSKSNRDAQTVRARDRVRGGSGCGRDRDYRVMATPSFGIPGRPSVSTDNLRTGRAGNYLRFHPVLGFEATWLTDRAFDEVHVNSLHRIIPERHGGHYRGNPPC